MKKERKEKRKWEVGYRKRNWEVEWVHGFMCSEDIQILYGLKTAS